MLGRGERQGGGVLGWELGPFELPAPSARESGPQQACLNLEKNQVEEAESPRQQNRALIPAQLNNYLLKDSHLAEQGK